MVLDHFIFTSKTFITGLQVWISVRPLLAQTNKMQFHSHVWR